VLVEGIVSKTSAKPLVGANSLAFNRKYKDLHHPVLKQSLNCDSDAAECAAFTLFYKPEISADDANPVIEFSIDKLDEIVKAGLFSGMNFQVKVGNAAFLKYIVALKYIALFVSVLSTILYCKQLGAIPRQLQVVEQRLLLRQSVLQILLSDPFYGMIFYSPNIVQ